MKKVILFFLLATLPIIAQFNPSNIEGYFRGTWFNNTFGSHDSAFVTIIVEETTMSLSLTLDLDGNVFGGSNPPPATMTGSYDQNGFNVSGTSPVYGDMYFTGMADGTTTGRLPNVPNPSIDSTTLQGKIGPDTITLNYYIYSGGFQFANGIIRVFKDTNVVVPVELVSFSASVKNNKVELKWATATEVNNKGFEIQRSIDGNLFNKIGYIKGKGTISEKSNYTFSDNNINGGKYYYRLKQIDFNGSFEYSDIINVSINIPEAFELTQNYPNPFNPNTKISFVIPHSSFVTLSVYNILGNKVATLVNEEKPAGNYEVEFNSGNLSSGFYLYKLQTRNSTETKKMLLLK